MLIVWPWPWVIPCGDQKGENITWATNSLSESFHEDFMALTQTSVTAHLCECSSVILKFWLALFVDDISW